MNTNPIMKFLAKGNKWQFDIPIEKQMDFINDLPMPVNDFQRSFNQYKAQMFFVTVVKRILFNSVCTILTPFLWIILLIKGLYQKERYKTDAIIQHNAYSGVVPQVVLEKYNISQENLWSKIGSLSFKDNFFLLHLVKYYFRSPYFVFKSIYKIALYSQLIRRYHPNAIIVFNEYSFTSSLLTAYCEWRGIEHVNIMHGEKLLYIRDSFFRFTTCYIWEDYYKELFKKLRTPSDQFVSATPPFMKIDLQKCKNMEAFAEYKYYLANYTELELNSIIRSMAVLKRGNAKIKYRPHPRYSNIEMLKKYVSEEDIEYPDQVNIMESVANCKNAVGCYTTVLNQAYHSGINVIIDDIDFPEIFGKLSELEYVLLNKNLNLLSKKISYVS